MTITAKNKLRFGESIEIHDELNPAIWTENKELKPEVEDKIEDIVDTFVEMLKERDIDIKVEDIYLLGSNANYNYNEDSDLDVHIIADESFDCSEKHLEIIYNAYKALFNNRYEITIRGINVEIYVENKDNLTNVATGIYSLKDGWIRKPSKYAIPEIDSFELDKRVNEWENKYFEITQDPTLDKIDKYIDDIYDIRKKSIKEEGEFGLNNLVFKEMRRRGYLAEVKELRNKKLAQNLSLENLNQ